MGWDRNLSVLALLENFLRTRFLVLAEDLRDVPVMQYPHTLGPAGLNFGRPSSSISIASLLTFFAGRSSDCSATLASFSTDGVKASIITSSSRNY